MKKGWANKGLASLVLIAGVMALFAQPAKADGLRVSFSSGRDVYLDHHRRDRRIDYYSPRHHRPVVQPIFFPAPWPRVYERTVYVDRPVIVQPVSMSANQASSTFIDDSGRTCREYQTQIVVDGTARSAYGTACLQPDGSWRVAE